MESTTINIEQSPSFLHRYYILLKGHYFLFFSAFGILYPVLNITLRSRGLSDVEISYLNLIIPFIVFFSNPLCGFLADHTRRYLLVFNFILGTVIISYAIMFLLPTIQTHYIEGNIIPDEHFNSRVLEFCANQEMATKCSSRSSCGCAYQAYCQADNLIFNFTFTMNSTHTRESMNNPIGLNKDGLCQNQYHVPIDDFIEEYRSKLVLSYDSPSQSLARCSLTCSIPHYCQGMRYPRQTRYILLYSILFIVGTNCLSNTIALGASIGFASLTRPDIFGQQRVWGTIGFGLSAFAASRFYSIFQSEFVYIIMFTIATIVCIIVTSLIEIRPDKQKRSNSTEQEMNDLPGKNHSKEKGKKDPSPFNLIALVPLLKKIDVMVFLSLAFIWGMSYAALDPYVYLYVDEIAPCQSRSIIGLMSLIAAISEIIAFYLAGRLIKFLGTNHSSVLIFLAFAIRFSGYYYIPNPYYFLFVETMHFFNFGILYVFIAQKADSIAPPGLAGTLQGLVYGVSFGLGRGVGLIISSLIYTRLQSRLLFLIFAIGNGVAAIVYSFCFLLCKKHLQKPVRYNANPNIPKIVIDSESTVPEEPLLISPSSDISDKRIIEQ